MERCDYETAENGLADSGKSKLVSLATKNDVNTFRSAVIIELILSLNSKLTGDIGQTYQK